MKINLIILSVIALISLGWVYYADKRDPVFSAKPIESQVTHPAAPNFTYTTIQGRTGQLSDHQGKVVLLHFWASWCAPCLVEFPEILQLATEQPKDFIILAVSLDKNKEDIQKFITRLPPPPENMIVIQDANKTISHDLYQTIKLPETYVISPDSKIIEKMVGPQKKWNQEILKKIILPLMP
jgi:thiol-disulfide isomerase/thioredoxin